MKIALQTTHLPPQAPLELLSVSVSCDSIDTDGAFVYFKVTTSTHHAFPEHTDKLVYTRAPLSPARILNKTSPFTRSETISVPIPLSKELLEGDRICVAYSFTLRKLKYISALEQPHIGPALSWQIILNVFTKVINKTIVWLGDGCEAQKDLELKKTEISPLNTDEVAKEVSTLIIDPPASAFVTNPSLESLLKSPSWDHRYTGFQMIASAEFF
jgi:hypothetical protein